MQLNSGVYIISYKNKNYVGSSVNLKKRLKEVWKQIPVYERGKELEIREWLKSSF